MEPYLDKVIRENSSPSPEVAFPPTSVHSFHLLNEVAGLDGQLVGQLRLVVELDLNLDQIRGIF